MKMRAAQANVQLNVFRLAADCIKLMVTRPLTFMRCPEFMAVYGVYSGTYLAANYIRTTCELAEVDPKLPILGGVTAVNMLLGIAKDFLLAKLASEGLSKTSLSTLLSPPQLQAVTTAAAKSAAASGVAPAGASFRHVAVAGALFVARDVSTIGVGFVLPAMVSKELTDRGLVGSKSAADKLAMIFTPICAQFVLTPVHLLALNFYNTSADEAVRSLRQRLGVVAGAYIESTSSRAFRVLFAYGAGGIVNTGLRAHLREQL